MSLGDVRASEASRDPEEAGCRAGRMVGILTEGPLQEPGLPSAAGHGTIWKQTLRPQSGLQMTATTS